VSGAPATAEPLRVALVGLGFGTHTLLPALQATPGVEVVVVCAAHRNRADAVARAHGIGLATDDFREAIELGGVDLACLCARPTVHAPMIECALDAGRAIFATKPLASERRDAATLTERAESLGVVTGMDFCFRYLPARRHLRQLVRAGFVGELRLVSTTVVSSVAVIPGFGPSDWSWVSERSASGGILGASLALHHVDLLRFTFGEPIETWGLAETVLREKPVPGATGAPAEMRPVTSEDTVVVQGRLAGDAPFSLTVTWSAHHPSGERVEAYGSEGTLVLEPSGRLLGARHDEPELRTLEPPDELSLPEVAGVPSGATGLIPTVPMFVALLDDMQRAIRGLPTEALFATFTDGLRDAEIAEPILARFDARAGADARPHGGG
jgi:predicted dehydrogenase